MATTNDGGNGNGNRRDRLVELNNTTLPDLKRVAAQAGIKGAQHLTKPRLVNSIIAKEFPNGTDGRVQILANLESLQALLNQALNQVHKGVPGISEVACEQAIEHSEKIAAELRRLTF
jgi:hypothetical protein